MKQRITLLLLSLAMVLSLCTVLSFGSFAEGSAEAWDGSVATAYAGGSGTPEDPYQIANGAQLALMAQQINAGENASASFILVENIVLNDVENYENFATAAPANKWTPIGAAEATPFSGTFNGNGKTVSGLYMKTGDYCGLFGVLDGATVTNVTLAKGYVKNTNYIGALVGWAKNATLSRVTNESVFVRCEKNGTSAAGGIAGKANDTDFLYCHNAATVSYYENTNRNAYVGGIVGECVGSDYNARPQILRCTSEGTILASGKNNNYNAINSGGIVGAATFYDIEGCVSKGTIKNQNYGNKCAGGIAASVTSGYVISCVSYCHIDTGVYFDTSISDKGHENAASNGGIVGSASYTGNTNNLTYVQNCVFLGTQNTFFEETKPAGSIGMIFASTSGGARIKFQYCYGLYTPYGTNEIAIGLYPTSIDGNVVSQFKGNAEITVAHVDETATDAILAGGTYADTTSIVRAMNNFAKAQGYGSTIFAKGTNGPEYYGILTDLFDVTIAPSENGVLSVLTEKSSVFPDDAETGYREGDDIVLAATPAQGYKVLRVEYTYGDVTASAIVNADGTYSFTMPAADVTISVTFKEKPTTPYDVVFLDKDGAELDVQTVAPDANPIVPAAPAVFGYVFVGWTNVATGELVDASAVTEAITLQATYEYVGIYTVTFVNKDGELIEEQVIEIGQFATPPAPPAVYSYEFAGWVDENGTPVNFNNVATDIVVKASYREIYCSVTFLAKDGSVIETLSVRYGTAATAPAAPVVEGYEFAGWDIAFDNVTTDLTVTAQYTYTGSFFDGGYGTPEEPFLISSAAQLADMAAKMTADTEGLFINGCYELTADIDLAGITWTPIPTFAGSIDGNGHTISNLTIKSGSGEYAMFLVASGTFKDLTLKDCEVSQSANLTRAILIANAQGTITIQNCHIINGKVGSGAAAGLMIGKVNADSALIEDCTVSGFVNTSNLNAQLGGFASSATKTTFKNCVSYFEVNNRNIQFAGGFVASCGDGVTFENCISYAKISIDAARTRGSQIGGFVGAIQNNCGVTANNCIFYGSLANNEKNQSAGGFSGSVPANRSVTITNTAIYGSIYATGKAGGLVPVLTDATRHIITVENVVILADISCGAEGIKGAVAASIKAHSNTSVKNVYVLSADLIVEPITAVKNYECIVLDSTTTLPEGLSPDVWAIGALPAISGVSISFDDSVALNVYAKYGIVLKAHAADKLYVDGKVVALANQVTLFGETYAKFTFDGIKMADIETKYALSLIGGIAQAEYSMFEYIANSYAGADEVLKDVLVALLCYGNAAQETPTAIANAVALIPELEAVVADYVEANYANVTLIPVQSEGLKVGFNLYGFVQPVFKVADSITRVTVEMNGIISELVTSDGYAFYYDLSMFDLNEAMSVTLYEGENAVLVAEYAVANYLAEGIAGDTLTDAEKNLCKAYAVFVDTLLSYANN